MKIKKLTAKNYKSLQNIQIDFNGNYCAISGRNNSGKSNIIHLLTSLLGPSQFLPWDEDNSRIDFNSDCTQWVDRTKEQIEISYEFILNSTSDKGLIDFIKKFGDPKAKYREGELLLKIEMTLNASLNKKYKVVFDGKEVSSKEVIQKLRNSDLLILHNSTKIITPGFIFPGKACYGLDYTKEEADDLDKALKQVKVKIDKISKKRKTELEGFLGKMKESYTVEFALLNSMSQSRDMPFDILLKNSNVKVPLSDWGSGTQNRTRILMSLMKAVGKKDSDSIPIMVIEEPESFLHPSAQAELGNILQNLSKENNIQIIVTTHSPHMLNVANSKCNILLSKPYGKIKKNNTDGTGNAYSMV